MTIAIVIYLIGYILAYLLCKYARNKSNQNNWSDVILSIIISLGSYATCILILLILVLININKTDSKPPRFL